MASSTQPNRDEAPSLSSRRDRHRNIVPERLKNVTKSLRSGLRPQFESLAGALHLDMHLITRADLTENPDLEQLNKFIHAPDADDVAPVEGAQDSVSTAGQKYAHFLKDIGDAIEDRENGIVLLANKGESSRRELLLRHEYHAQLAKEEHKFLAETIRSRLIQQLNTKRRNLLREKESLDISEGNALLLNPAQYNLTNPASPGGMHKRSTRNTGRRNGDDDDRRKRKPLADDIEAHSPAPGTRELQAFPWRDSNAANIAHQHDASIYSIDRLFTDKELQLAMNNAAVAATNHLLRTDSRPNDPSSAPISNSADNLIITPSIEAPDMERSASSHFFNSAHEMERSHSHQTRGATSSHRSSALADMAAAAIAREHLPLGIVAALPCYIPAAPGGKANGAPAAAAPLNPQELEADLALFGSGIGSAGAPLSTAAATSSASLSVGDDPNAVENIRRVALMGAKAIRPAELRYQPPTEEQLERERRAAEKDGGAGAGAVAAGQAALGGAGMKRTASGTGFFDNGLQFGRKVRQRYV